MSIVYYTIEIAWLIKPPEEVFVNETFTCAFRACYTPITNPNTQTPEAGRAPPIFDSLQMRGFAELETSVPNDTLIVASINRPDLPLSEPSTIDFEFKLQSVEPGKRRIFAYVNLWFKGDNREEIGFSGTLTSDLFEVMES
jgi:hypothetical protein